ncbi:amino acid deaminase [Microbacterium sp. RD1]|uniref:amino acid deaminase n=1 Tax=Microbacterium sp. RD1 TaxID=3457313 RepID=UPI003FA58531
MPVPDVVVSADLKGFPAELSGRTLSTASDIAVPLARFETPVMTVDMGRVHRNERRLIEWAAARGIGVAPHGKTTMSPALWHSALDAGAVAITFATPWQVRAGFSYGVRRALLANNLVDPVAIRALADILDGDPEAELWVWADSVEVAERLAGVLEEYGAARPMDVLVDLGGPGGRTGARSVEDAIAVADVVRSRASLRLRGVAGYEGPFGSDRSDGAVAAVVGFLDTLGVLAQELLARGWFGEVLPIVSAGGSTYPDFVAERLGSLAGEVELIIRSGAFQVHDSGFYERVSPLRTGAVPDPLEPAIHVWARVISAPEPGLVLLDAGRRDVPVDIDFPVIEGVLGEGERVIPDAVVTGVNDQHAFVRGSGTAELRVGDVVKLGLSHPCTAFDKWRALAVVDGASSPSPSVTGALATLF